MTLGASISTEMMDEFALDDLERLGTHIYERSREAVLAEIAKLPKGSWSNSMSIDGYNEALTLAATVTVTEQAFKVDYSGTSPAVIAASMCRSAIPRLIPCIRSPVSSPLRFPNNTGSLSPFKVSAPDGSLLNASRRKPVSGRHNIGHMLPDVVLGCLRQAIPERVPAEGASGLWLLNFRGELPGGAEQYLFDRREHKRRPRRASDEGRTDCDRISIRSKGHTHRNRRSNHASGFLEKGTAAGFRWRRDRHRGGLGQIIEIARNDDRPSTFSPWWSAFTSGARKPRRQGTAPPATLG